MRVLATSRRGKGHVIVAPALLLALWNAEAGVVAGLTVDQALNGSARRFGVSPAELCRLWLRKLAEADRASVWLAQPEAPE